MQSIFLLLADEKWAGRGNDDFAKINTNVFNPVTCHCEERPVGLSAKGD